MGLNTYHAHKWEEERPPRSVKLNSGVFERARTGLALYVEKLEELPADKGIKPVNEKENPNAEINKRKRNEFIKTLANILTSLYAFHNKGKDQTWRDVFRKQANDYLSQNGLRKVTVPLYGKLMDGDAKATEILEEAYLQILEKSEKIFNTPQFHGLTIEEYEEMKKKERMEEDAKNGNTPSRIGADIDRKTRRVLQGVTEQEFSALGRVRDEEEDDDE
ncbi:MAG: hypothetical protein WC269_03780 [Candidatus Gracilibacteria bacterium]|jgi:hypothetical protein